MSRQVFRSGVHSRQYVKRERALSIPRWVCATPGPNTPRPLDLLGLEFEERLGPIPTRSRSVLVSTHPLSRYEDGPSQLLRMGFVRLDVVALEQ